MIKLTAVLLGNDFSLAGFRASGKPTDFGMLGQEQINVNIGLADMLQRKFVNNQIDCSSGVIREIGGFKVRNLPSAFIKNNGDIEPCSNKVDIVARFMSNNEPIGYRIRIGQTGQECDMSIKNIITMTNWLNPNNFVIKHSAQDKMFICGKPGFMKLEELPIIELGDKTSTAKRPKSAAQDTKGEDVNFSSDFDILDLFDTVNKYDGFIIRMDKEKYERTVPSKGEVSEEFISAGLPEVASGLASFNPKKLSVNSGFKKIGTVYVDLGESGVKPIYTYTFCTKSIISSADKHMNSLVVGVPAEYKEEFIKKMCKTMGIKEVPNPEIVNPIRSITGVNNLSLISIDTSKIDLISKSKAGTKLMPTAAVRKLIVDSYQARFMSKYYKTMIPIWTGEEMIAAEDSTGDIDRSKLFKSFANCSYEQLNAIINAGIDIFNGAYTKLKPSYGSSKESGDKEDKEQITLEYTVDGYNIDKITGKEINGLVNKTITAADVKQSVDENTLQALRSIASISNISERVKAAEKERNRLYAYIEACNKELWLFECAMLLGGNYAVVHWQDKQDWKVDTKFRGKKGMRYICDGKDCDGLTLEVTGVTI